MSLSNEQLVAFHNHIIPSGWKWFDLKSSSPTLKGIKSKKLKLEFMLYSHCKSSLTALSLLRSNTWNGPSTHCISLNFLCSRIRSFLIWIQTKSPYLKITWPSFVRFLLIIFYLNLYVATGIIPLCMGINSAAVANQIIFLRKWLMNCHFKFPNCSLEL